MNEALLKQISNYAEDREIDYISAKVIGEQQGINWQSEAQLVEFKQTIDLYLKTFDISKFELVEEKIEELCKSGSPKKKSSRRKAKRK